MPNAKAKATMLKQAAKAKKRAAKPFGSVAVGAKNAAKTAKQTAKKAGVKPGSTKAIKNAATKSLTAEKRKANAKRRAAAKRAK